VGPPFTEGETGSFEGAFAGSREDRSEARARVIIKRTACPDGEATRQQKSRRTRRQASQGDPPGALSTSAAVVALGGVTHWGLHRLDSARSAASSHRSGTPGVFPADGESQAYFAERAADPATGDTLREPLALSSTVCSGGDRSNRRSRLRRACCCFAERPQAATSLQHASTRHGPKRRGTGAPATPGQSRRPRRATLGESGCGNEDSLNHVGFPAKACRSFLMTSPSDQHRAVDCVFAFSRSRSMLRSRRDR
jgi:hypothetical protein